MQMNHKTLISSIIFIFLFFSGKAQETTIPVLAEKENELMQAFNRLATAKKDTDKRASNALIKKLFNECLTKQESFDYQFSKLKYVGILKSQDEKLRIYTWNVPLENGEYEYFGFLQYKISKKEFKLIELYDKSSKIISPEQAALDSKNWFGALYYQIVDVETKRRTYYTLLGWDGNDLFSNKKLVDVLYFTNSGTAKFGYPLFVRNRRTAKRILFEYSKTASMVLRYEPKLEAIVFDRLVPTKPTFTGNFKFYVPDVTTDGLILGKNDRWNYIEDIETKNKKNEGLKNRKTEVDKK